jgi:cyclic pyranopterin phosphate synthase
MEPSQPRDRLGRPLGVLRLSLTARCNLACPYCLPDGQEPPGLLDQDQRLRLIAAAVALGANSLRLTGGEPLLHPGLEALIAAAAAGHRGGPNRPPQEPNPAPLGLSNPPTPPLQPPDPPDQPSDTPATGLREIALTSNGTLLSRERALALRAAGLDRLTLSLDGGDGASVAAMAGLADPAAGERALQKVLAALDHARAAGFEPGRGALKLNAVIQRGRNEEQLLPLAALARERGVELRLIEFMDVGNRNGWRPDQVLPAAVMLERIQARWPLEPLGRPSHGTAQRYRYRDGGGHLALVASVSAPFCGDCNRLRVSADGIAYTCLFARAERGLDLRPWLNAGSDPRDLQDALASLWRGRHDRWSEERSASGGEGSTDPAERRAEMAYLGG